MIKESNYFYNAFLILKEAIAGKSKNKLEIKFLSVLSEKISL